MAATISDISFTLPCIALLAILIKILHFIQDTILYSCEALCIFNLTIQTDPAPRLGRLYRSNHSVHWPTI